MQSNFKNLILPDRDLSWNRGQGALLKELSDTNITANAYVVDTVVYSIAWTCAKHVPKNLMLINPHQINPQADSM